MFSYLPCKHCISQHRLQRERDAPLSQPPHSLAHSLAEDMSVRKQTHSQLFIHSLEEIEFALESLGQGESLTQCMKGTPGKGKTDG